MFVAAVDDEVELDIWFAKCGAWSSFFGGCLVVKDFEIFAELFIATHFSRAGVT